MLLAGGQAALGAELQRFGTQAGRAVGDGQADQVSLAAVGKVGLHLGRGVNLLPLLIQLDEAVGRLDLGEQGEFLLASNVDLFRL